MYKMLKKLLLENGENWRVGRKQEGEEYGLDGEKFLYQGFGEMEAEEKQT